MLAACLLLINKDIGGTWVGDDHDTDDGFHSSLMPAERRLGFTLLPSTFGREGCGSCFCREAWFRIVFEDVSIVYLLRESWMI